MVRQFPAADARRRREYQSSSPSPPPPASPIIDQVAAYYIMKVSERKAEYTKPLADVRSDIEKKISSDDRDRLQEQWVATLRKKAFIKIF